MNSRSLITLNQALKLKKKRMTKVFFKILFKMIFFLFITRHYMFNIDKLESVDNRKIKVKDLHNLSIQQPFLTKIRAEKTYYFVISFCHF